MSIGHNIRQSRGDKDCGCKETSEGKTNAPQSPCPPLIAHTTYNSVEVRIRKRPDPEERVKSECFHIPLKSGGSLNLAWYCFNGLTKDQLKVSDADGLSPAASGWLPAGLGGCFSFFPYLTRSSGSTNTFYRISKLGLILYDDTETVNGVTYFGSTNPSSYSAWYDENTTYFTEYDRETQTYFMYAAGPNDSMRGRPIQIIDRNGNVLEYHYSDNADAKPLLRKITGDLTGITPYFDYTYYTYPAVITKIHVQNDANPSESRTIYFRYDSTSDDAYAFVSEIESPQGCVRRYDLFSDETGDTYTYIRKEEDALGYTTYFFYIPNTYTLSASREPENSFTYYKYDSSGTIGNTVVTPMGRPPTYYHYYWVSGEFLPQVTSMRDPSSHVTYYEWSDSLNRATKQQDPNGKISNFEYNSLGILQKKIEDGITTEYYTYEDSLVSPTSLTNAREYTTYFEYDGRQNPTATVDALGNRTEQDHDSAGRVISRTNARDNTTYFKFDPDSGKHYATIDAEENVTYYSYNVWGELVHEISPRWQETGNQGDFVTYHEYDKLSRLLNTKDALGNVTYYEYSSRGELLAVINPRGASSHNI